MNISIKGVDRLLNKLDRLNHIRAMQALEEVSHMVIDEIKAACPKDSGAAAASVGISDKRDYKLSAYMDIGLSRKTGPWDSWKGAYFQNYGYHNWGRGGIYHGKYVFVHQMWFENVANSIKGEAGKRIKARLKMMILAEWGR